MLQLLQDLLERVDLVLDLRLEAEDDVAVHLHEAAVAVPGEALVAGLLDRGRCRVASLRPMLRTVSIMPGMETRAPERQETSSGFLGSPNLAPIDLFGLAAWRPRPGP